MRWQTSLETLPRLNVRRLVWPLHYAVLAGIMVFGAYLRLTGLNKQSLWFDEADIVVRAQRPFADMLSTFTASGENGPLYNLLLAIWIRLAGISEIAVRFPSAVAGVLAIPAIYWLARRLSGPHIGLLSAGLLTISPYHVWYSQEAKMYSMVVLLALGSTICLVEALRANRTRWWIAYIVVTTLMFYTHVATVLVFVAQGAALLITHRRWQGRWRAIIISGALLTLPYVPIAFWALKVVGDTAVPTWQPDVSILEAFQIIGVKFAVNRSEPDIEFRAGWLMFALAAGGAISLFWTDTRREQHRFRGILLVALTLVPIIGLYLVSLRNSVFSDRYIIVSLPAYLLLIAAALYRLTISKWLWPIGYITMLAIVIYSWAPLQDVNRADSAQKEDWRSAYAHVAEQAQPGDVLLLHPGYIISTETYYSQREPRLDTLAIATIPTFRVNWLTKEIMIDLLRIDIAPRTRFWLVQSPIRVPPEDPNRTLETWLDDVGTIDYEERLNGVEVTLYQLPDHWWDAGALVVK